MIQRFYKWLWKLTGKHPWTWYIRREARREPLVLILLFSLLCGLMDRFDPEHFWINVISVAVGILLGHLWW